MAGIQARRSRVYNKSGVAGRIVNGGCAATLDPRATPEDDGLDFRFAKFAMWMAGAGCDQLSKKEGRWRYPDGMNIYTLFFERINRGRINRGRLSREEVSHGGLSHKEVNHEEVNRERAQGGHPFILSPSLETLFDYEDFETLSGLYAHRLTDLGVSPGSRVIVQVDKSPQCLFLYLACLRSGAIYLPLNTAYQDDELTYFMRDASPALVVCDPRKESFFKSFNTATKTLDANGQGSFTDFAASTDPFDTVERAPSDTATILYTSGTTGHPKGAMITHENLAVNGLALHQAWQWRPGDIMLHALPIFHVHGLFVATHLPILNGSPIILLPAFDPQQVAALLPSATVYMGVPTNYTRLIATGKLTPDLCRNMRLFTCGSAPLLAQTFREFQDLTGHEPVERYGMTETGMNTSNPVDGKRKPGAVGPPLPGVRAKILNSSGKEAATDEPGNLLVKGRNVFRGYWQLPEKTREEFTADGFFRTGDIASRDEDGYISIVGRSKDMIISGGLNIYPKEIETIIDKLNGVDESAVIGLPHPDFGEGVCAVVVARPDAHLTEESVIADLKTRLANFKTPKWVHFVDALPRNSMGKVQKNKLRDAFSPGHAKMRL